MYELVRKTALSLIPRRIGRDLQLRRQYSRYVHEDVAFKASPHRLESDLIVSITSYPPRFGTLHLTIRSILDQNTVPDRLILWIAKKDLVSLPYEVKKLSEKVDIRQVDDLKSYKKLIFALEEFPNSYIVTADDDVYYDRRWLETLVSGAGQQKLITCHRAHRIPPRGHRCDYMDWDLDVQDETSRLPSGDILPTGVGGILYPPNCLHPDVRNPDLFMNLAPTADDLWFFWCARRMGSAYARVGANFRVRSWINSQENSLFSVNQSENNAQLSALYNRYGDPTEMPIDL